MRAVSLIALLLASSAAADADGGVLRPLPPMQVHVRATPATVKLGEPFEVEVAITHAPEQRYELVTPGDLGDFEFSGQERSRVDGKTESTTTVKVKLAAFALGKLKTPALSFEVADPAGTEQLPVAGTDVEIVSSLPPEADKEGANLMDVRPPEQVPVRTWRLLYALAAALATGLLAYGLYRYLSRPRPVAPVPLKPAEPLDVRATKALDELAAQNLPAQQRFKEFYFRLSEILRSYLGERYDFEALESTTPELLSALRSRHTPGLPMEDLAAFAHHSDFVRYAKALPTADECKAHLELGYRVVHGTTAAASAPPPAAPPQKPAHGPQ